MLQYHSLVELFTTNKHFKKPERAATVHRQGWARLPINGKSWLKLCTSSNVCGKIGGTDWLVHGLFVGISAGESGESGICCFVVFTSNSISSSEGLLKTS